MVALDIDSRSSFSSPSMTNGSIGADLQPGGIHEQRFPCICLIKCFAIGERTEFMVQANNTLPGKSPHRFQPHPRI